MVRERDKTTLYVDIDSTLYDFTPYMKEAIKELTGVEFDETHITSWDFYFNMGIPKETVLEAFDIALHPDKIMGRVMYPGAAQMLGYLYDCDLDIHFLSHNPKPHIMRDKVKEWLGHNLDVPFDVTIFGARNCKVSFMLERGDAVGIVEDKPATLRKAAQAGGIQVVAKEQLWNKFVIKQYDIHSFDHWVDFPIGVVNDT